MSVHIYIYVLCLINMDRWWWMVEQHMPSPLSTHTYIYIWQYVTCVYIYPFKWISGKNKIHLINNIYMGMEVILNNGVSGCNDEGRAEWSREGNRKTNVGGIEEQQPSKFIVVNGGATVCWWWECVWFSMGRSYLLYVDPHIHHYLDLYIL